jgi:hypothetical protein
MYSPPQQQSLGGGALEGGLGGAALGAVGGAIGGNAGEGAAIGAAVDWVANFAIIIGGILHGKSKWTAVADRNEIALLVRRNRNAVRTTDVALQNSGIGGGHNFCAGSVETNRKDFVGRLADQLHEIEFCRRFFLLRENRHAARHSQRRKQEKSAREIRLPATMRSRRCRSHAKSDIRSSSKPLPAVALLDRSVGLTQFTDERVRRADVQALMPRIRMVVGCLPQARATLETMSVTLATRRGFFYVEGRVKDGSHCSTTTQPGNPFSSSSRRIAAKSIPIVPSPSISTALIPVTWEWAASMTTIFEPSSSLPWSTERRCG